MLTYHKAALAVNAATRDFPDLPESIRRRIAVLTLTVQTGATRDQAAELVGQIIGVRLAREGDRLCRLAEVRRGLANARARGDRAWEFDRLDALAQARGELARLRADIAEAVI